MTPDHHRPVALITGASSGIGRELARIHARKGGELIVVSRDEAALNALRGEVEQAHGTQISVIPCDLSLPGSAQKVFQEVERQGVPVDILVNNAGFGGHGLFDSQKPDAQTAMLQVNVVALTELTRLFVPGMIARRRGRILNLASMAGFLPGPFQAVYYATKAYVLSLSEALADELQKTGVTVTALCPGPTASGFQSAAGLQGVVAFRRPADAHEVAEFGYAAMERGETIAVPGVTNRLALGMLRLAPRTLVTKISRKTMEKHA